MTFNIFITHVHSCVVGATPLFDDILCKPFGDKVIMCMLVSSADKPLKQLYSDQALQHI